MSEPSLPSVPPPPGGMENPFDSPRPGYRPLRTDRGQWIGDVMLLVLVAGSIVVLAWPTLGDGYPPGSWQLESARFLQAVWSSGGATMVLCVAVFLSSGAALVAGLMLAILRRLVLLIWGWRRRATAAWRLEASGWRV